MRGKIGNFLGKKIWADYLGPKFLTNNFFGKKIHVKTKLNFIMTPIFGIGNLKFLKI